MDNLLKLATNMKLFGRPRGFLLGYATFPDIALATQASETLVAEKIIACANITAPHTAIYRWQGKIESQGEIGVWIKLRADQRNNLKARLRKLHPYEVPALVCLKIVDGLPEYLAWVNG